MTTPATSRCPSSWLVIGEADARFAGFAAALGRRGAPAPARLGYDELARGRAFRGAEQVRLESPGRRHAVTRALLACGAAASEAAGEPFVSAKQAWRLAFDKGHIAWPRQQYRGLCALLAKAREAFEGARFSSSPDEVMLMFDKPRCRQRLARAGVAVPASLGPVRCFDELWEAMRREGRWRVFVKLDHGSSASGVVAYRAGRGRHQAVTTVELSAGRLYNTRRLRRFDDVRAIAAVIDALGPHGLHAEVWIPKAGLAGRTVDLRVLAIAGEPAHAVARLARGPITNLHLGADRGPAERVLERMTPAARAELARSVRDAAGCFPGSLAVALDIAVTPSFSGHAVLEVNAFGDLLHGVRRRGRDTYDAELAAWSRQERAA